MLKMELSEFIDKNKVRIISELQSILIKIERIIAVLNFPVRSKFKRMLYPQF
jgi:hypothetical protein